MKEEEVKELTAHGIFENEVLRGRLEETHISWVILTKLYAFKLKKPIKLSFLDFSTLSFRKHFCEREIVLNRRFTDIYLDVLPVRLHNGSWFMGGQYGMVIDYAVRMKRLRESKRMDNVVRKGKLTAPYIDSLAKVVASFHLRAEVVKFPFDIDQARNTFNDITVVRDLVLNELGAAFADIIDESLKWSDNILSVYAKRFQDRIDVGFRRDVHGDLHSGNIFLYREPVLFDCIEFNDDYRQIDVLYEIAFLCMELEVLGHKKMADVFISSYKAIFPCFEVEEDEGILNYYQCLRANVRAKVHGMSALQ
ncbi:MAG: hypothetical protein C0490_17095, partial [Marivirga sp.]|nr:hypothetical protein [Marivirga sp.]